MELNILITVMLSWQDIQIQTRKEMLMIGDLQQVMCSS